ncbi:MAG TPA: histidinol-phosphate transaminase [Isosphaeraceae bacterium]|jgi:histidinol-phosphate/aromatic aminotransferase/cobyric acid decarboxylase-like protein|nr:histidinol-phosphate transaminase [Isosphaeraceae bacterium]
MVFPVDLSLFEGTAHSPSFLSLRRSMGRPDLTLRDYCVPVNPYFPTRAMFDELRAGLEESLKYYPSSNEELTRVLCRAIDLDPASVVLANGSTELITWIDRLLVKDGLATPVPTFGRWTDQPAETGKAVAAFETTPDDDFALDVDRFAAFVRRSGARAAAICNPNNPTGALVPGDQVLRLLDLLRDLEVVVVDESFIDFADTEAIPSIARHAAERANVVVLKSLGKNFGLHGVRFGYAVARPGLVGNVRKALPHWNLNGVAEAVIRSLAGHRDEYERGRRRVILDRQALEFALRGVEGLRVFPSRANFVYVRVPDEIDGVCLRNRLLTEHGCFVRECGNKLGSDRSHFRIAARPSAAIPPLIEALRDCLAALSRGPRTAPRESAPALSPARS